MPGAAFVVLTSLAVASLLASCGATDIPAPRRTVTVTVDAPGAAPAATPAQTSTPTSTSTGTVSPRPSPSGVPTALAAGRQRGAPHSYAEAKARLDAARPAPGVTDRFESPSGNIVCSLSGSGSPLAACEVEKGRTPAPLPSICPPDGPKDIGRIELDASGAFPVCNSDSIREGDEPELGYGRRTGSDDPVACLSEEFGVTCVDTGTQHGFFLARGTFVTF